MPVDSQKQGKAMSGGMRIDDHKWWGGSKGKDSVFPDGPHKTKEESSAEGSGSLSHYEDTTEAIKSQQMMAKKKVQGHPQKVGHRN
jgi:hypothetical protein